MRASIFFLTAVAATAATPAFAQDFTGPRVEANIGYDAAHNDNRIVGTPKTVDGFRVGGAVGYDVALGKTFTIGVEGGLGFAIGDETTSVIGANRFRTSTGRDLDLSLRLGARVASRTLIYAKAGYANSEYSVRLTNAAGTIRSRNDEDGVRVGVGVEQSLGEHVYAKAEYRYTDYGHDLSRHQALVGVGYQF